jgi:hypothetical protein
MLNTTIHHQDSQRVISGVPLSNTPLSMCSQQVLGYGWEVNDWYETVGGGLEASDWYETVGGCGWAKATATLR